MTGTGAAVYCGFFALAALWLFATRDPGEAVGSDDDQWGSASAEATGVAPEADRVSAGRPA